MICKCNETDEPMWGPCGNNCVKEIDENNRTAKRKLALFRALLAMRGAKVIAAEHDTITVECIKGDEQGCRDLALKFGITLGGVS